MSFFYVFEHLALKSTVASIKYELWFKKVSRLGSKFLTKVFEFYWSSW